mgnify:CR=1 FL=1
MANDNDLIAKHNPIDIIDWEHSITENTFDEKMSKELDQCFNDWENKRHLKKPTDELWNDKFVSYVGLIFFPDTSRWKDTVDYVWARTKHSPRFNVNARDYMVVLELSIMKPNSNYHFHIDDPRKQFTGVCYWRQGKEGTIVKSGENIAKINFKHNRCLWFSNIEEDLWRDVKQRENNILPWHTMENKTDMPRYTVNINYTPQHSIDRFLKAKSVQFNYYLKNKKPLWIPTVL